MRSFFEILESRGIKIVSRDLFILAHQIGDKNFYPAYKRLIQNQWKSYKELKEEQRKRLKW
jgi:phenylacetate-CoA ligase